MRHLEYDILLRFTGTAILLAGLLLSHLSGYTTLIASRGGLLHTQSMHRSFLGAMTTVAMISMYVWAFAYRSWWLPIVLFLTFGLLVVPALFGFRRSQRTFGTHYRLQPAYDIGTAVCAGLLWWAAIVW
jgi:hypothetical protein